MGIPVLPYPEPAEPGGHGGPSTFGLDTRWYQPQPRPRPSPRQARRAEPSLHQVVLQPSRLSPLTQSPLSSRTGSPELAARARPRPGLLQQAEMSEITLQPPAAVSFSCKSTPSTGSPSQSSRSGSPSYRPAVGFTTLATGYPSPPLGPAGPADNLDVFGQTPSPRRMGEELLRPEPPPPQLPTSGKLQTDRQTDKLLRSACLREHTLNSWCSRYQSAWTPVSIWAVLSRQASPQLNRTHPPAPGNAAAPERLEALKYQRIKKPKKSSKGSSKSKKRSDGPASQAQQLPNSQVLWPDEAVCLRKKKRHSRPDPFARLSDLCHRQLPEDRRPFSTAWTTTTPAMPLCCDDTTLKCSRSENAGRGPGRPRPAGALGPKGLRSGAVCAHTSLPLLYSSPASGSAPSEC
ncbi:hypothetical protein QTO34_012028 [Cnephaeus nilssonii]|uniref:Uncharacterized protein n=1 Tax=Cnephaeus nilssonii TaxID=3371016 RepID=A0AA40LD99_CNENI|nr:hypothetical protein QTO34_012028 [Eptesicus nilssonii]